MPSAADPQSDEDLVEVVDVNPFAHEAFFWYSDMKMDEKLYLHRWQNMVDGNWKDVPWFTIVHICEDISVETLSKFKTSGGTPNPPLIIAKVPKRDGSFADTCCCSVEACKTCRATEHDTAFARFRMDR